MGAWIWLQNPAFGMPRILSSSSWRWGIRREATKWRVAPFPLIPTSNPPARPVTSTAVPPLLTYPIPCHYLIRAISISYVDHCRRLWTVVSYHHSCPPMVCSLLRNQSNMLKLRSSHSLVKTSRTLHHTRVKSRLKHGLQGPVHSLPGLT